MYDQDECFNDGDAGLMFPPSYTIQGLVGAENVVSCDGTVGPLETICQTANWGIDIDIDVHNTMPGHEPYLTAYVNVLVDWNHDGVWANDPSTVCPPAGTFVPEHVLVDFPVPPLYIGPLSAIMPPPPDFLVGPYPGYVWVRFSITEYPVGDDWNGEGIWEDGETEDYLLRIDAPQDELDWGDAPDPTYPTLSVSTGANHLLDGVTYLGASVDPEPDGQPNTNATGDDLDILYPPSNDDEDGVTFGSFVQGSSTQITVTANTTGYLNAWLDFDGNGDWAGEQIFTNQFLAAGSNIFIIAVPGGAALGFSYARFRFTSYSVAVPAYTGHETDGEVEDYKIFIHEPIEGTKMENPPQYPDPFGWDVNMTFPLVVADDWMCSETGTVDDIHFWVSFWDDIFPPDPPCGIDSIYVSIHSNNPQGPGGYSIPDLLLWDFIFYPGQFIIEPYFENIQGWYSPAYGDTIPENHFLCHRIDIPFIPEPFIQEAGTIYWLDISVFLMEPGTSIGWKTSLDHWEDDAVWCYFMEPMWFELWDPIEDSLSLDMAFAITGTPIVEDSLDWGDAPDPTYPTLSASTGANHLIVPGINLGASVDAEPDGQPDSYATGDDNDGNDDEDGVTFNGSFVQGLMTPITVTASTTGYLNAWLDRNADGDWADAGEQIFNNQLLGAGPNALSITIAPNDIPGFTYARFRFSSQQGLSYTGSAIDGEVEDYRIFINEPIENIKMENPPQYPDPFGWDVDMTLPLVVADDWLCSETGTVDDVHFWVSYWYDDPITIEFIHLSIHSNNPVGPYGYSEPDSLLWEYDFFPGQFTMETYFDNPQGWYSPAYGEIYPENHLTCYRIDIVDIPQPFIQEAGTIYWLDISISLGEYPYSYIGWKTSLDHWEDDAVWGWVGDPFWEELWDPLDSLISLDMAFVITGTPVVEDSLDWGDAPDPTYPTLSVNTGANHLLDGVTYLGASVDAEPDGQPNGDATGDDLDILYPPSNDDEDGVTFGSLVQGSTTQITVTASNPGFLNAWLDFNGDGSWAGEQIFTNQPLAVGANTLIINVPGGAAPGFTYSRFRFTSYSVGVPAYTGHETDGEVEDYKLFIHEPIEGTKMENPPQYPDPFGWDVDMTWPLVVADDWMCSETGTVDDVHFWVSCPGDSILPEIMDPPFGIVSIRLSIHSNDPIGSGYSIPDSLLWEYEFIYGQFVIHPDPYFVNIQGWYSPYYGVTIPEDHYNCYKIDIDIPQYTDPFILVRYFNYAIRASMAYRLENIS
jgi:hypothetical protein